ncbi:ATP-NAD kinase family protein [Pseudomaricurvus alkylphenolicus]|uniref:ATP-NAD kinase family protein n=1 Tax=Pseudomaricurvus alkylphenolicus TaxID=1306991 RepID=UPI00141E3943|nr:ATP-NAD kinase family protein [Pseudomaricurvus alkylphenolicus]NIB38549.1 ATP-NAD kinase family protein [Pseudomaricurvus alkylphenolicus]
MVKKKIGVIINPVAGMGGRVGLKGSDGAEILQRARKLGAKPEAATRSIEALKVVAEQEGQVEVLTYPGEMGADACRAAGLSVTVIGSICSGETTAEDTRRAANDMAAAGVDLILFAGGDGTARVLLDVVGLQVPVIGIPAGVKIHSAVYALSPRRAGEAATEFLQRDSVKTREVEVMDIDEDAFRKGEVNARLYGYLSVPDTRRYLQSVKTGGIRSEQATLKGMVEALIQDMEKDCYYIIGPGTTTRAIMEGLDLDNTLLGVDVVRNFELIANDVSENQLLEIVGGGRAKIVVTAIGGQGHILGRGNHQLSPGLIRKVGKENLIVFATKEKLASLSGRPLLVDTGDQQLNAELSGYVKVMTGKRDFVVSKVGF